jgi:hypothetical protein
LPTCCESDHGASQLPRNAFSEEITNIILVILCNGPTRHCNISNAMKIVCTNGCVGVVKGRPIEAPDFLKLI